MNEAAQRVLDLLTYIEQVERLKKKPPFSVPVDFFVAFQYEMRGLPEVQFNLQQGADDVWLRIPRLQEIPPPSPDELLSAWIALPKSPEKSPQLKTERLVFEGKQEVRREQLKDHPEIQTLFDWYVENQWNPWASAERPRRETISRYNKLFALQQLISSEGAETPIEIVWGIGYAAWKKQGFATPVKHPLIVQSCEIILNEKTFELDIRPRDVEARLEADCYSEMELPGVLALDAFWKSTLSTGAHRVNPFEMSTFEGVLKAAVGHLDPSGSYEERLDDFSLPTPDERLKITNTWVLFARKRSGDIFIEDVRRLKASVENSSSLPDVIRSFVSHGDDTVTRKPEQPFRGLSSSDSPAGAFELYFPMPYNDEQVSIIQKLQGNDGVVVQGPPGTGKTHTIANVICHYLAQGKRVLVTAKGESALAVLQEKLPERIRPLSVSLLSDERDGMKQFEHSIQTIASSVASLNPSQVANTIAAAEAKLNQLHAKIASVDQTVAAYAHKHMSKYEFQGREITPEEMAKLVLEQADAHQWFDDEPPGTQDGTLPVEDSAISALRSARIKVGRDLDYLNTTLPAPDEFPSWHELAGVHKDLLKARTIEKNVSQGSVLALADSRIETFEKAQNLVAFILEREELKAKVASASLGWTETLKKRLAQTQQKDPMWNAVERACEDVRNLEATRRDLLTKAIELPAGAELNSDFNEALGRLTQGKSAFQWPIGKGEARKLIQELKVQGVSPTSKEEWELVASAAAWRIEIRKAVARWNSLATEFDLPTQPDSTESSFRSLVQAESVIQDVHQLVFEFELKMHERITEVFGRALADKVRYEGDSMLSSVLASLQAHVDKGQLAYATMRVQALIKKLQGCSGKIVEDLRSFLFDSIGHASSTEDALQSKWAELQVELVRLVSLRPYLNDIRDVVAKLNAVGAVKWALRLRTEPASEDMDSLTPGNWMEAWNWRQMVIFLDKIDGHHKLRELFAERKTLTTALSRTYQELVAEKTWLGVFNNSPDSVRQALQAYLNAVQSMGSGTGVRAIRHRKTARDAMVRAYKAVPCWVLPQWRVSETIPAEVGLFDLVVIDEASQSDIWALPALLRGKKLLVVGDHKQVSPSAVGTAEEKIKELSTRYLANQPHGAQMTPDKSIYDLARVVFAGNSVMLKEHFRCVPAIIEFSNREFYEGDIKPLRLPKANERLDPPLVDVYVKGGYRKGDINPAEAQAIVNEIREILADSQFNGKSIGVVTLLGIAQAAHIQELVSTQISPSDVLARKIAVGPPPVFQGRERDIMMVSMVLGPGDRAAQNKNDTYQRFNVALSRARDRMYLFRSVLDTTFKEDTLNARLIQHFKQPFRQDAQKVQSLREKCESGFEVEMFDELTKRGYRVQPQVPCGGYRIDFVVEGTEGRRLAIECDGDQFHGPGQWSNDMARQRVLERAGWTFWRCFASSFVRRKEEVLIDLLKTLSSLGIEPLGSEAVDNTAWVHYKEADPFGVDEEIDEVSEVSSE